MSNVARASLFIGGMFHTEYVFFYSKLMDSVMLIVLKLIHMLRKRATLKTSGHASATAFFSIVPFSQSHVRPHIPVCVNHMSSETAKNTADISRLLGKHSETERSSEFFV